MIEVVGVRFKKVGKIYYFDPKNLKVDRGTQVIVETIRGTEIGETVLANRLVAENERFMPLSPVIRIATNEDLLVAESNVQKEKAAAVVWEEKIKKHGLIMSLIDVEYTFDNNKIIFYYVADGRVDFRELVKDLAAVFKTRIDLRQIGVRDETKALGGIGICGKKVCCANFLSEFVTVTVKMAKDQSLSTNPQKISGACGKLICCLNFEQSTYEEAYRYLPKVGYIVDTPNGQGTVVEVNVLKNTIRVRLEKEHENTSMKIFDAADIKILRSVVVESDEVADIKDLE